ncbi:MAG: Fe-S protein assembly co-chaperone HscB [Pseudomonadales bacterium]|nr:Fe-S protein assembly co-chaperone HscB [Pseudomonadales bacterium]
MNFSQNFFEIFQINVAFDLDVTDLSARYQALQKRVHPDRYAGQGDQAERLATQWATQVNVAYATLSEPLARASYLLDLQGVVLAQNPTLDPTFLFEQIELRETLDEIRQAGSVARAESFIHALAVKQSAEAQAFNDYFKAEALTEATTCVYRMQFLSKLSQGAKALEEELLGY